MTLYETALRIAAEAHKTQVRKHDGSPYIVHPVMVAQLLQQQGFSETIVAAGLAHDVLEDSDMPESELREKLGDSVVDIVTAVSEDTSLPWEERKEQYVAAVAGSTESVWAVSVADKIHNAQNLIANYEEVGSEVWSVFNRGKEKKVWFERMLLTALQQVWQHPLLSKYVELVDKLDSLEA